MVVSPTYVPDLVNVSLDLLIDRERGIWHLTNAQALSWADLARRACDAAGVDASRLEVVSSESCGHLARRPEFSALSSERAMLMPSLDDALRRYVEAVQDRAHGRDAEMPGEAAHYAS
jgi:dTDP-4-dehydrorhamnose reductase